MRPTHLRHRLAAQVLNGLVVQNDTWQAGGSVAEWVGGSGGHAPASGLSVPSARPRSAGAPPAAQPPLPLLPSPPLGVAPSSDTMPSWPSEL